MLKEALQLIAEQAVKATAPQPFTIPSQGSFVRLGDKAEWMAPPFVENYTAKDFETIAAWTSRWLAEALADEEKTLPEHDLAVWYDTDAAQLVRHDRSAVLDKVVFPFKLSKPFERLQEWAEDPPSLTQEALLLELRTTFAGVAPSSFLKSVRSLRWSVSDDKDSEIDHGKASIGRKAMAQVTGVGEIPEEIAFSCFTHDVGPKHVANVTVVIELDVRGNTIRLHPRERDLVAAIEAAEANAGERLRELVKDVPVYHGKP